MRVKTFFERSDDLTVALQNIEDAINNFILAGNASVISCQHQVTVDDQQVDFLVSAVLSFHV